MIDNFAVFILSYGRAEKVRTAKTLKRCGYTGRIYIIIDNEDAQAEMYYKNFGRDNVIMFDKADVAARTDCGDNIEKRNTVLFARNAAFEIAKKLDATYFLVLDDDYKNFSYRINGRFQYAEKTITNLDAIIEHLLKYYKSINCASLAIAQNGDFFGGVENTMFLSLNSRRKAMNFWLLSTERQFAYVGRMNDDVNTYVSLGNKGTLFLTFPFLSLVQERTQSNSGGLTSMYNEFGTYVKSFYSIMYTPSAVKIAMMGEKNKRLHHSIAWDNAVPVIISENWRK